MMHIKKPFKLTQRGIAHYLAPLLVFVLLFGVVGTYFYITSRAAAATYEVSNGNGVCIEDPGNQGQAGIALAAKTCDQASRQIFALTGTGGTSHWHTYKVFATSSAPECIGSVGNKQTPGTRLQAVGCSNALSLYLNTKKQLEVAKSGGICVDSASGSMILSNCSNAGNWNPREESAQSSGGGSGGSGGSGGTGTTSATGCSPGSSATDTMNNTTSSKCGFPDTTNTGAKGTLYAPGSGPTSNTGHGWTVSGDTINVAANGLLENVDTNGKVVAVNGANAVVNNVKVVSSSATGSVGIGIENNAANVTIEHSTIAGGGSGSSRMLVAIKDVKGDAPGEVINANNIYYASTGIQVYIGTIENNYIHNLGQTGGDHVNGFTNNGSSVAQTIQHNTVFNQFSQTDAISLFEDFGVQSNKTINDNLVAGGGYCIYGGQNAGGPTVSNIHITNNHFSRMYFNSCGGQGGGIIAAEPAIGKNGNTWSGNVWDDTGATINP